MVIVPGFVKYSFEGRRTKAPVSLKERLFHPTSKIEIGAEHTVDQRHDLIDLEARPSTLADGQRLGVIASRRASSRMSDETRRS